MSFSFRTLGLEIIRVVALYLLWQIRILQTCTVLSYIFNLLSSLGRFRLVLIILRRFVESAFIFILFRLCAIISFHPQQFFWNFVIILCVSFFLLERWQPNMLVASGGILFSDSGCRFLVIELRQHKPIALLGLLFLFRLSLLLVLCLPYSNNLFRIISFLLPGLYSLLFRS